MIRIVTDDGADLKFHLRERYDIRVLPIGLTDGEREIEIDSDDVADRMYDGMRAGVQYSTSRVASSVMQEVFREYLEQGDEVIYVTLSSGLSGSYEGAELVKREFEKEYPGKLHIVDSLAAAMGVGVMAIKAAILRDRGESAEDIVNYLEDIRSKSFEFFAVGGLEYLHRGGRVSKATKVASGVLQVHPILEINKVDGELKVIDIYRGKKSLFKKLRKYMREHCKDGVFDPNQTVYVYDGDWPGKVNELKEFFVEEMGVKEENVNTVDGRIGCIIGAHTGPEIIVATFSGDPDELSVLPPFEK
ncbi:MAG: DegV family protein [Peptoniphilus sp.]|nr:DegV family protein [Peptoniphilus sp.]MDD7363419.1 DegV family protein [Bacillota bacterium]MDY6044421.1 DegV family protein [Peptoniphilus sp.]